MQLTLRRPPIADLPYTIGDLYIDDVFFSNTMEDRDRGIYQADSLNYILSLKEQHKTAIPYGTYQVVMSFSNRFKRYLPELLDVPGFAGIRIHAGNTETDTSGCLLPGIKGKKTVIRSVVTTTKLIKLISEISKCEKVFISIIPTLVEESIKLQ